MGLFIEGLKTLGMILFESRHILRVSVALAFTVSLVIFIVTAIWSKREGKIEQSRDFWFASWCLVMFDLFIVLPLTSSKGTTIHSILAIVVSIALLISAIRADLMYRDNPKRAKLSRQVDVLLNISVIAVPSLMVHIGILKLIGR